MTNTPTQSEAQVAQWRGETSCICCGISGYQSATPTCLMGSVLICAKCIAVAHKAMNAQSTVEGEAVADAELMGRIKQHFRPEMWLEAQKAINFCMNPASKGMFFPNGWNLLSEIFGALYHGKLYLHPPHPQQAVAVPEGLLKKLAALKLSHLYCEDSWYSCPLHPDGCADERQAGCNCGAEDHNKKIDELLETLSTAPNPPHTVGQKEESK